MPKRLKRTLAFTFQRNLLNNVFLLSWFPIRRLQTRRCLGLKNLIIPKSNCFEKLTSVKLFDLNFWKDNFI